MIYQISDIKTRTAPLSQINKGLIQARHIQARLKESIANGSLLDRRTQTVSLPIWND